MLIRQLVWTVTRNPSLPNELDPQHVLDVGDLQAQRSDQITLKSILTPRLQQLFGLLMCLGTSRSDICTTAPDRCPDLKFLSNFIELYIVGQSVNRVDNSSLVCHDFDATSFGFEQQDAPTFCRLAARA
jgi:hypothetical protein